MPKKNNAWKRRRQAKRDLKLKKKHNVKKFLNPQKNRAIVEDLSFSDVFESLIRRF